MSWRNIAEQYYARITELEAMVSAPLDAAEARIAELEAEVARLAPGHTDMMVPPETLDAWLDANPLPIPSPPAEETQNMSIPDIDPTAIFSPRAALARIAELEASRDHYRTAGDSATLRASQLTERNDYQAKRIAELGAENTRAYEAGKADGLAEARPAVLATYARIAGLEAEWDHLRQCLDLQRDNCLAIIIERDRLKAALTEIISMGNIGQAIRCAGAALSGKGV